MTTTGTIGSTQMSTLIPTPTTVNVQKIITLIARVVRGCNFKCGYCWFRNFCQPSPETMPFDVVEKLIRDVSCLDQPAHSFVWLGGEPLLAGMDFFKHVQDCQKRYLSGKPIRNRIQTNALVLDDDWIKFLMDSSFKIGISIDGPKDIQDHYRVDTENKGSFDRVFHNVKRCQGLGLKFGAIATITDISVNQPERIFDFFVGNNIKGFGFNFAHEIEKGCVMPFSVTANQYAEFMIKIFDRWLEADDPMLRIREIDNLIVGLLGGKPKTCSSSGTCGNFFSIDVNGDILPCERFTTVAPFGNLMDSSIQGCLSSRGYQQHNQEVSRLPRACLRCQWLNACHGGCAHYRGSNKPVFCVGNKRLLKHIVNRLTTSTN